MVFFIEDSHTYWTKSDPKVRLLSPSSLIKPYVEEVDEEYWQNMEVWNMVAGDGDHEAGKKILKAKFKELAPQLYKQRAAYDWKVPMAAKLWPVLKDFLKSKGYHPNDHKRLLKQVRDRWDWNKSSATYAGSKFHLEMEHKMYETGSFKNFLTNKEFPVVKPLETQWSIEAFDDISPKGLKRGVYPEFLVYNQEWNTAGLIDIPYFYGNGKVDVLDYKTDKEKPNPKDRGFSKLKGGLDHLPDTSYYKYSIKTSIYMLMLESHGWKPGRMALGWSPDYRESTLEWINIPYLKDEADFIVQAFLNE